MKTFDPTRGKSGLALRLMELRFRRLRLSQRAFADRFGISLGAIKDAEQMRGTPCRAARVLIEVIALDPKLAELAAQNASAAMADLTGAGNPQ